MNLVLWLGVSVQMLKKFDRSNKKVVRSIVSTKKLKEKAKLVVLDRVLEEIMIVFSVGSAPSPQKMSHCNSGSQFTVVIQSRVQV
ncbi:hypothetical protein PVK06_007958 [Gossypium arboreum]|uniref:Uncharacterized protein n=1 Tax=Gossypium arboreum TaxID=29729 RepID=A0ABR0QIW3_GOSAR|nr:hypothetical protein PVK06_007958 [Gossypium arboreum]